MQHWPALLLKVYHRAVYVGQDAFVGYALCPLPTTPGLHHLSCQVWAVEDADRSFAQQLKGRRAETILLVMACACILVWSSERGSYCFFRGRARLRCCQSPLHHQLPCNLCQRTPDVACLQAAPVLLHLTSPAMLLPPAQAG